MHRWSDLNYGKLIKHILSAIEPESNMHHFDSLRRGYPVFGGHVIVIFSVGPSRVEFIYTGKNAS